MSAQAILEKHFGTHIASKDGERVALRKRDGDNDNSGGMPFTKSAVSKGRLVMTGATGGHAHLIEVDEIARSRGGGYTDYSGDTGDDRHNHPYTIDSDGKIVIGEARGHTHSMMGDAIGKTTKASRTLDNPISQMLAKSANSGDAAYEALAKAHMEQHGGTIEQAYLAVSMTEHGAAVYEKSLSENAKLVADIEKAEYGNGFTFADLPGVSSDGNGVEKAQAEARFNELAKMHQTRHGGTIEQAALAVSMTPEGADLYAKTVE